MGGYVDVDMLQVTGSMMLAELQGDVRQCYARAGPITTYTGYLDKVDGRSKGFGKSAMSLRLMQLEPRS